MKLIILNDYEQASEWAAKYIRNKILMFDAGPDRYFTLGLPTGKPELLLNSTRVFIESEFGAGVKGLLNPMHSLIRRF